MEPLAGLQAVVHQALRRPAREWLAGTDGCSRGANAERARAMRVMLMPIQPGLEFAVGRDRGGAGIKRPIVAFALNASGLKGRKREGKGVTVSAVFWNIPSTIARECC